MEESRVIKFGPQDMNTAVVTEEAISKDTPDFKEANRLIRHAGKAAGGDKMKDWEYMGSAAVHYFRKASSTVGVESFTSACQVTLDEGIEEGHADHGWKQLRDALQKSFGRKLPKVRK